MVKGENETRKGKGKEESGGGSAICRQKRQDRGNTDYYVALSSGGSTPFYFPRSRRCCMRGRLPGFSCTHGIHPSIWLWTSMVMLLHRYWRSAASCFLSPSLSLSVPVFLFRPALCMNNPFTRFTYYHLLAPLPVRMTVGWSRWVNRAAMLKEGFFASRYVYVIRHSKSRIITIISIAMTSRREHERAVIESRFTIITDNFATFFTAASHRI